MRSIASGATSPAPFGKQVGRRPRAWLEGEDLLKKTEQIELTSDAEAELMAALDDIRRIVRAAPHHLRDGGWLLLEHGYDQAASVRELLAARGFAEVQSRDDLAGIARCSGGIWRTVK